jgi:hypothetical protein
MNQLDPTVIRRQIENLKVSFPDLAGDDESWQMSLESETDLAELLTNVVRKIDDAKALVIGTKDRFEELEQRKARFEHRIDALRQLAFKLMQSAEVTKLELPIATLSIRNGAQQIVGENKPEHLPDDLCKVSRAIDRTKVKEALKAGQHVPGFSLSNAEPSLSIRVK